jgi:ClpX C4-type zinc finger
MTARKHLKRQVRARAARTGESYTAALRYVRHHGQEVSVSDVDEPVLASCSFCKKNNHQVKKLVAGPGVYICNECLALCDHLVEEEVTPEDSAKLRAQFLDRAAEDVLAMLPGLARTAEEVETELRRWVLRLRQLDTGWDEIAAVLQLSEDEVRQRFDRLPTRTNVSGSAVSTTRANPGSAPPSPPPE